MTLVKQFENCKNCDSPLAPKAEYCVRCGAQVIGESFSFKFLKDDFSDRFLEIDNNILLRTIKDMFRKPEQVIGGYLSGVRKRHIRLSNYIAIAITLSGLTIFILQNFPEALDISWMIDPNNPAFKDNPFLTEGEKPQIDTRYLEYQGLLFILMIPLYALLSKLTFYNQKAYSYLKHMVIVGYTQAQLSIFLFAPTIILLLLGYNYMKISNWLMLFMFLYSCFVYKRLFKLSLGQIIGRTLLFIAYLIGIVILYLIGVIVFMMVTRVGIPTNPAPEVIEAVKDTISYISSSTINWTS